MMEDLQGNQLTGGLPTAWTASTAFPAMRGSSGDDGMCGFRIPAVAAAWS